MKLIYIFAGTNPVLRIVLIIVMAVAAHFMVRIIRRFSQLMLAMKVGRKTTSETSLIRRYPKIATTRAR